MSFLYNARVALKNFAEKLLDIDDTSIPREQLDALRDRLQHFDFNTNTDDVNSLVRILRKKHLVDSICVSTCNGSLIASSDGNDLNEAVIGTAMLNYVKSEFPHSKAVLIKSDDWYMLLPYNKKVYIIKACSDLSLIELEAIARDVEHFLDKNSSLSRAHAVS